MEKETESIWDPAFTFRMALNQVSTLNGIFPIMYESHTEWLIQEYRKKLKIRDKKHQQEIMNIISKYDRLIGLDTELQQLEGLNSFTVLEVPELKEHNLNLPIRFVQDPLRSHSFALRTFVGSKPQFLREMSIVFLITHFEAFLKKLIKIVDTNQNSQSLIHTGIDLTSKNILTRYGIDFSTLVNSKEDWVLIKERFYRRNNLVHSGSIPDKQYRKLTKISSLEPFVTDEEYMLKTFELFFNFPDYITTEFEKLLKNDTEKKEKSL